MALTHGLNGQQISTRLKTVLNRTEGEFQSPFWIILPGLGITP
jgi:hypothetical protein